MALLRAERHPQASMKLKEAAKFLAVSPMTLRRFVAAGLLTPVRLTEDFTFELEDLKALRAKYKGSSVSLLRILEKEAA